MTIMLELDHDEFSKLMFRPIREEYGHKAGEILTDADEELWDKVCDKFLKYEWDTL